MFGMCIGLEARYFCGTLKESSFNMTRGGGGDEDIEGGSENF